MAETLSQHKESCNKHCDEHTDYSRRVHILEENYSVVEKNNLVVSELTGKVTMLMWGIGIVLSVVSAMATYTFSSLGGLERGLNANKLEMNTKLQENQTALSNELKAGMKDLERHIEGKFDSLDRRLDQVEKSYHRVEIQIENFKEHEKEDAEKFELLRRRTYGGNE